MTQHDDTLYVALMRDEIREAMDTVGRSTLEEFAADRTGPHVVAYHFMRLATRPLKASDSFRAAHPEIPWNDLAEIRARVEDEHFHGDPAEMWRIVTTEFPVIVEQLEALLPVEPTWRYQEDRAADKGVMSQADTGACEVDPAAEARLHSLLDTRVDAFRGLCRQYDVKCIRLFGSVLRDDFGPDSDVDMMVDFGPGAPSGWKVFGFDDELSGLLGHTADVMHGQPVRYIGDQILDEARTVYVADTERGLKEGDEP